MKANTVSLQPVTQENWKQCVQLQVLPTQQGLVASNQKALAEVAARPEATAMAIQLQGEVVGFLVYLLNMDDGHYYVHHFMVDANFQCQGIGYSAMRQLLERLEGSANQQSIRSLSLSWNADGLKLCRKLGFEDTGRRHVENMLLAYKAA